MYNWKKSKNNNKNFQGVILENLGVKSDADIKTWFDKHELGRYRIDRLDEAVKLVKACVSDNIPIHIIGDKDADGICSTTILVRTLDWMGANVTWRLPTRDDGYGANITMIDEAPKGAKPYFGAIKPPYWHPMRQMEIWKPC
jgi:hypothetical protein